MWEEVLNLSFICHCCQTTFFTTKTDGFFNKVRRCYLCIYCYPYRNIEDCGHCSEYMME